LPTLKRRCGLWNELDGGRLQELGAQPLIQKYCLGFQKVRTHDKPDAKCRVKVKNWWSKYPAEVEGSDPKSLDDIGRGQRCFLKIGDFSFDALKFALKDSPFRVANTPEKFKHSHINAIRFDGGLLDGTRVPFSPNMNCLIGIQGSGKSSILECIRYTLDVPFGDKSQDREYKEALVPYVLKSGGKVVIEATDKHGERYEIHRILNHAPNVFVDGAVKPGISIRETVVSKPLYFGQKDLSAAGKDFGRDLVEKLVGDTLKSVRQRISTVVDDLRTATEALISIQNDADLYQERQEQLNDVNFRLEQFDKHGVKATLEKQVEFKRDAAFCDKVDDAVQEWYDSLEGSITDAEEAIGELSIPDSKSNADFFKKYGSKLEALRKTVVDGKAVLKSVEKAQKELSTLHTELDKKAEGLAEEFAKTERELAKALADKGASSIQPDTYVKLAERKAYLTTTIADLRKRVSKSTARRDAVLKALTSLDDTCRDEFKQIGSTLAKINSTQGALKIEAIFKGDKTRLQQKMEEVFQGTGIRKETYKALSEQYPDFAAIFRDLDEAAKLAKGKGDVFRERFSENLFDLLSFQVPNDYDVTYHGKPLKSHSLGQRASAMMLFLLSQDDSDLLMIDQPEDDLDSQTIYEEVVKLLRKLKSGRQFIFATHNANFPVLGDSESVSACTTDDNAIKVASGSIDTKDCQAEIVNIMEGGVEAFERRKTIYEIWRSAS
jgi:chromosome segregation protein